MQNILKVNRSIALGAVILLCAFIGVGYVTFTRAEAKTAAVPQSLPVKITRFTHEDKSFRAVAERGNAHVAVVVQRKSLRDESAARDPEIDSPYESDIVVYNRHGYPLALSVGGKIPIIDPATGEVTGEQTPQDFGAPKYLNQVEQIEDLQSVVDMAKSLRKNPDIGEKFRWEIRAVQGLAQWSLDHANDFIEGRVKAEPTPDIQEVESEMNDPVSVGEEVSAIKAALSGNYTYQTYIKWANIWPWGQHSAVLVNVYNSYTGAFVLSISTRNHGREASDPSMATASGCPKAWSGRTLAIPLFQPYLGTDTTLYGDAGGCNTPYVPANNVPGVHVCNDDSLAEYWNLKYNTQGSWLTCGDSSLRVTAPTCD